MKFSRRFVYSISIKNFRVLKAIKELKERKGSSKAAILKYIGSNYKVGDEEKKVGTGTLLP